MNIVERARQALRITQEVPAQNAIRDLIAVVERLPVTADGVPYIPIIDKVVVRDVVFGWLPVQSGFEHCGPHNPRTCYSSIQAAEDARGGK